MAAHARRIALRGQVEKRTQAVGLDRGEGAYLLKVSWMVTEEKKRYSYRSRLEYPWAHASPPCRKPQKRGPKRPKRSPHQAQIPPRI